MEMPISKHQEEPAKNARVPPGKEGLFKGPASSEPKAAGSVLTQLSEAERLGISDHILPKFLLLSKHNPMLPAGLTNRIFLLPTASVIHSLAGLLCFSSPPPPHFSRGGLGTCPAQEELAKPSDLQTFAGSNLVLVSNPRQTRNFPPRKERSRAGGAWRKQWMWLCPRHWLLTITQIWAQRGASE